ncbi:flavodoxin domain-containing protein, partial [Vibrio cholerae]|uniref:flavodoxin domain-containing protein n=1 Tax=Vibrio cholerae TaxID=666 RepID=UPI0034A0CE23
MPDSWLDKPVGQSVVSLTHHKFVVGWYRLISPCQTFLKKSPWQPERIAVFAGALYYPRYRWFDKMMIRLIMTLTGGETD